MKRPSRSSCLLGLIYLLIILNGSGCDCDDSHPVLEVSPSGATLQVGATQKFTAFGHTRKSQNSKHIDRTHELTWSVGDPSIATIDGNGVVTALRAGSTTVSGYWFIEDIGWNGLLVVVDPEERYALEITPEEATVPSHFKIRYTATAVTTDGTRMDVTPLAEWSSSNNVAVPTLSYGTEGAVPGEFHADHPGRTEIVAKFLGASARANLIVNQPIRGMTIEPSRPTIGTGLTQHFRAIARLTDSSTLDVTNLCEWTSSDLSAATIPLRTTSGYAVATGVDPGQTEIRATASYRNYAEQEGRYRGYTSLTVSEFVPSISLSIIPEQALSAPGAKRQYKAIATYSDNSTRDVTDQVTWSSSDSKIVVSNDSTAPNKRGLVSIDPTATTGQSATITATLGSTSADATLHLGAFAYVANHTDGNVSTFGINSNGTLTGGALKDAGSGPSGIAVDLNGRFAYVSNEYDDTVSMFSINSTTGALSGDTTVNAGNGPIALAIAPNGRFLYVANFNDSTISTFEIDPTDGTLQGGDTIGTGANPIALVVDPKSSFLYVANSDGDTLSIFEIENETGALTLKEEVESETWPWSLAIDPTGSFLCVTYNGSNEVAAFAIDPTEGTLTEVARKSVGSGPLSIALDVTGSFAYVTGVTYGTVSRFEINPDGSVTDEFIAATGVDSATRVVTDPSGRFLYVVYYTGVSAFSRDTTTGNLAPLGSTPAGGGADAIAVTP